MKAQADIQLQRDKFEFDMQIKEEELNMRREQMALDSELKRKAQQDQANTARVAAATAAAAPTNPTKETA